MSDGGLEVHIEERPQAVILQLRGRAGVRQMELLQDTLGRLLAGRPQLVIVDVHRLEYLARPAMQALARLRQALIRQRGRVILAGVSASLRRQLVDGGVDGLFPKVLDVRTVLDRLPRPPADRET